MGAREENEEQALVVAAQGGSPEAVDKLLQHHRPMLAAYFSHRLSDKEMAENLTQETTLAVFKGLSRFHGDCPFSAWMTAIANNLLKKHLERDPYKRRHLVSLDTEETVGMFSRSKDRMNPDTLAENQEFFNRLLHHAQKCCTPDEYYVIGLYYQGESLADIAEILNKKEETVRSWFFRARGKLIAQVKTIDPDLFGGVAVMEEAWRCACKALKPGDRPTEKEKHAWQEGLRHGNTEDFRAACLKMAPYLPGLPG